MAGNENSGRGFYKAAQAKRERMIAAVNAGESVAKVAKRNNITRQWLYKVIKENNKNQ